MQYILDPFIPTNKVHLLGGSSGAGKSTLMHQLCDSLRKGEPFLNQPTTPMEVIYVGADGDLESYRQLETDLGIAPLTHINVIELLSTKRIPIEMMTVEWLYKQYINSENCFIVLDPPDLLLGVNDFNNKRQVAEGWTRLWRLSKLHNITWLLVVHTNKTKKNDDFFDKFNRIGGSHSIQAYSSTKMILLNKSESDSGNIELVLRGKRFPDATFEFERDNRGKLIPLNQPAEVAKKDLVQSYLAKGVSRATAYREISKLLAEGRITQTNFGYRLS